MRHPLLFPEKPSVPLQSPSPLSLTLGSRQRAPAMDAPLCWDLQCPPPRSPPVLPSAPYPPFSIGGSQQQCNQQGHGLQLQLGVRPGEGGRNVVSPAVRTALRHSPLPPSLSDPNANSVLHTLTQTSPSNGATDAERSPVAQGGAMRRGAKDRQQHPPKNPLQGHVPTGSPLTPAGG